jgi:subtilisin family serine protease
MSTKPIAVFLVAILAIPLVGSLGSPSEQRISIGVGLIADGQTTQIPSQDEIWWDSSIDWWEVTTLDSDRNGIHDSLQSAVGRVNVVLSYTRDVTQFDIDVLVALGYDIHQELPSVDALLLGDIKASQIWQLSEIDGVIMVERYGSLVFYGDVQTLTVKARNSTEYPVGAWNLGVSGSGVNIALTDTGVDNEHPGLSGKFVAGYDAVCYITSDPTCILAGGRQDDGSFDPDDGNQHGTACMGMASATGIEADGSQSEFYGAAPNASLIDVRIGTDVGAGPFENYVLEQEFYESALNGLQWVIDHKDDAWPGVGEENYGIDIISLSWGITSHENGGSDGSDAHSRMLDAAMEAGVTVSNAAGNDGEDNDGLSGMSSSSLSITVAATDDQNTVSRSDDTIAGYSSRGPRRDNGDGNPLNELIPEVSAPGSNIIQAEGCVTSGGCNNNIPGQDASGNTYTGRGSGTSYATPSVSGVIALVIEANANLTPLQIKEVLKQTAERRGEASVPEVDPYWNREFGYGMVDAYAAVQLALFLSDTDQTASIDPNLQNHLLNVSTNGSIEISGHAWSQSGEVERVEFRIDNGGWFQAFYNESQLTVGALTPFDWFINLDASKLGSGNHTVEIRAASGDLQSLPIIVQVQGIDSGLSTMSIPPFVFALVALVGIAWVSALVLIRVRSDDEIDAMITNLRTDSEIEGVIEAELLD